MLNTVPLGNHKNFGDYSEFLIQIYLVTQWEEGTKEIHLLFDNPGRQKETPKEFGRN